MNAGGNATVSACKINNYLAICKIDLFLQFDDYACVSHETVERSVDVSKLRS